MGAIPQLEAVASVCAGVAVVFGPLIFGPLILWAVERAAMALRRP